MTAVATAPAELEIAADDLAFTVYSKPACVQCKATYRRFDKDQVEYKVADALDPENYEFIKELGHQQAPVIVARSKSTGEIVRHWSGFNPGNHDWADGIMHPAVDDAIELLAA